MRGPTLLCPNHRPDPVPCNGAYTAAAGQPCAQCKAEDVAQVWQNQINEAHGLPPLPKRFLESDRLASFATSEKR